MSNKVFVGGISWNTDTEGLRMAFEKFGEVSDAKVITDRETGRSRGFGFITFEADDAASKAISEMDGQDLDGRTIKVNAAEDKPRNSSRSGGHGGGQGGGNRW